MNSNLIETLKEVMGEPNKLTPQKLKVLIDETMGFFQEIQSKFDSKDPKQREEALQAAIELKSNLEVQMESLTQMAGLEPSEMAAFIERAPYSAEERETLDEVKVKLQEFQNHHSGAPVRKQRRRAPKLKLIG
jgi:hypothetical protein